MKKVYGIGIGPGDKELLTLKGYRLIKECDYIFAPESRGKSLAKSIVSEYTEGREVIELAFPMGEDNSGRYKDAACIIERTLSDGECAVFLTLGDPMTYSTYIYLMNELTLLGIEVQTVPGVTSYNAAAAALNTPITIKDESFVLCDGKPDEEMLKRVESICILKMSKNKEEILSILEKNDFKYSYVRRCSQDEQKILFDKREILLDNDYMSLIFARKNRKNKG